jgi:intracellular multiplication protein IcmP
MAKGGGGAEPQGGGADRSMDILWGVGALVVVLFVVWYFGKVQIAKGIMSVKFYEIIALSFVLKGYAYLASLASLPPPNLKELSDWLLFINSNYGTPVDFKVLANLNESIGNYIRYPAALLLLVLGWMIYIGGISRKFKNFYDMGKLRTSELVVWPQYSPVAKLDLVKMPLDLAPWASAQGPMRFCKKHDLLNIERGKDGKYIITLRPGAAYRILSLQLGPKWRGYKALPDYLQAIFAIFAARINDDKKSAENLLDTIAGSSVGGKPNFAGVAEILAKYGDSKKVQKVVKIHGYAITVMASMLVAARETGVLSTAEFIWLKPIDRRMWYMLNSVGRYTSFTEVAGPFAHWLAEKKLGLALMVPMVEEAVKGLELVLSEIIYKPEETDE